MSSKYIKASLSFWSRLERKIASNPLLEDIKDDVRGMVDYYEQLIEQNSAVNIADNSNESARQFYVYMFLDQESGLVKIGRSNNPKRRLQQLKYYIPELVILETYCFNTLDKAILFERKLHTMFHSYRKEYSHKVDGYTEFFNIDPAYFTFTITKLYREENCCV